MSVCRNYIQQPLVHLIPDAAKPLDMITTKDLVSTTLATTIANLDTHHISSERKAVLTPLVDFIQQKLAAGEPILLNFICTHNSRRSHLTQIWAQTMAHYFNIRNVQSYSGGTEVTAVFPMVINTLQNSGFQIDTLAKGDNPIYAIKYASNVPAVIGFSKTYEASFNPTSDFCAVMTCSQADGGCPFIAGAAQRIPITYEDPKAFDNSPLQQEKYAERSLQIATEMYYVFSQIQH